MENPFELCLDGFFCDINVALRKIVYFGKLVIYKKT